MEEEKDPSPDYIQAFNDGYLMQQHEPELLKQILSKDNNNEKWKALKAGQQQYEREQFQREMNTGRENGKDKERDK